MTNYKDISSDRVTQGTQPVTIHDDSIQWGP